jgi:hypothetical protein
VPCTWPGTNASHEDNEGQSPVRDKSFARAQAREQTHGEFVPESLSLPSEQSRKYEAPPRPLDSKGAERTVGLEMEFAGLDTAGALAAVHEKLGGTIEQATPTQGVVRGTPYGDFSVELDSTVFKERAYVDALKEMGLDFDPESVLGKAEEVVLRVVGEFVPLEVVAPPVPWSRLGELDALWSHLRVLGARGTHASWRYGFGLHINAQVAEHSAEYVLAQLKSFLLLEPWLVEAGHTDLSRRVGPFIRPFPKEYKNLVLDAEYWPAWDDFVADYLRFSPTRDRPLDLLPIFAGVDLEGIKRQVEQPHLVRARPTFHYRLPNCDIDEVTWSPAQEWNRWVFVERLGADRTQLNQLSSRFGEAQNRITLIDPWPEELAAWMAALPGR